MHFLTSEKEITELVWLLRASGIRKLYDMDVAALVDIHLEVHKELRTALQLAARAKLNRVEHVEEGVEKIKTLPGEELQRPSAVRPVVCPRVASGSVVVAWAQSI